MSQETEQQLIQSILNFEFGSFHSERKISRFLNIVTIMKQRYTGV